MENRGKPVQFPRNLILYAFFGAFRSGTGLGEDDPINIARVLQRVQTELSSLDLGIEHAAYLLAESVEARFGSLKYHGTDQTVGAGTELNWRVRVWRLNSETRQRPRRMIVLRLVTAYSTFFHSSQFRR